MWRQINTFGTGPHIYTDKKMRTGYRVTYTYVLNENPSFITLGAKPMNNFCGSSIFLENWLSSKSFEPVTDFLAYLQLKSWFTNQTNRT